MIFSQVTVDDSDNSTAIFIELGKSDGCSTTLNIKSNY